MIELDSLKSETIQGIIEDREREDQVFQGSGILPEDRGVGQTFGWDIYGIERDIEKFSSRLAAATPRGLKVIGHQTATLARTFLSKHLPGGIFMDLRGAGGDSRQSAAEGQIALETTDLSMAIDRQNEFMYAKALQDDLSITLENGVAVSVSYGMPAANKFVRSADPDVGIPVSWEDPSAKISIDVRRIKRAVRRSSGYKLTDAWVSERIMAAMCLNDSVKDWIRANPAVASAILAEGVIVRAFGLNWHVVDETYLDGNDAVQYFLPENRVLFTPKPRRDWGYWRIGSDIKPKDDRSGLEEVVGRYGYSDIITNPGSIVLYQGEVRLPILRIPGATARADVASA
jgi:hypothetical protein